MRIVRIILWFVYFAFLLSHIALLYFGRSSIITTILFYLTIGIICWKISNHLLAKKNPQKLNNINLLIFSFFCCFILAEAILKYGFQTNLSRSEQAGDFFYKSEYRNYLAENLIRKYLFHQSDLSLFISNPNSKRIFNKKEFSFDSRYNSLGLRGPEPDTASALINIIGLGDSFTEGFGVPEDSSWFNLFINQITSSDSSKKIQGINGGYSGSDVFFEYVLLKKSLLKYKPAFVILDINSSDIDEVIMRGGFERYKKEGTIQYKEGPWWEYFYSFSFIFRDIIHIFYDIHWNLLTEKQNVIEATKAENLICGCIRDNYKELALKEKFKLIVALHPRKNELQSNARIYSVCKEKLICDKDIIFFDMQAEMENKIDKMRIDITKLYYPVDLHHTALGNKVWAEVFSDQFRKMMAK